MRFQINRIPPLALYWAFIVLLSFVNIFCVYYQLLGHDPFPFRSASITSAAESLMLLLLFVFLRRRWLWIAPAWFVLLSAVELSNLLFYRNFDDFISPSSYFTAANFNGFVFDSALASLRRSDIVFALTSLAAVAVTSFIVRRRPVPSRRLIISYAAVALLFAAMQFTHAVRSIRFYHPQPLSCALRTYAGNFRQDASWLYYMTTFGFPGYFVRAGVELARPGFSPTEADFAMSRRFWQAHALAQPPLAPSVGSVLAANTRKNLVFIVVESLNSKLFDLPERDTVMPGLTACI